MSSLDPSLPTARDVRAALDDVMDRFGVLPDEAWAVPAAGLDWTCRETAAHVLDDLAGYALQLSGAHPHATAYLPLVDGVRPRPDGPGFLFWPREDGGTAAIVACLDGCGGLLEAVVASVPPDRVGWHPYGDSNRAGFAAMGLTELVLHTYDILTAHGVAYRADDAIVARVLDRIFPGAARTADPWHDLLRTTGRTDDTRGRPWRWDSAVRRPPA